MKLCLIGENDTLMNEDEELVEVGENGGKPEKDRFFL